MPVIDQVANDYINDITFLAVAGRGDLDSTRDRAADLFSNNLIWGLDDDIWSLYGIPGQPTSVLIANGVVVDLWFGALAEPEMRKRLDNLVAVSS
ncbi:MAG: hypothetical protein QGD91_09835 [Actinomycetota bacterium]|nr:hypothetical protein [Actinomycetota bacterium]MDK1097274.1 hypothetical protein [Actinomycetota bacterium]